MATNFSRLPVLPSLRDFIHMYRLQAKKILSQNYLMDMNLTRKHLAEASEGRLHIHRGDILKTNIGDLWNGGGNQRKSEWSSEPPSMNIIGNLPFNVASPLIIKLLKDISYRRDAWRFGRVPLTLTFQLEVAMRLCSPVDNDARSRISVMAQYLTEPKIMFRIPGACFVPRPEIDVGVVRFVPRIQPLINASFEVVEKVCRHIFFYRQKHMIKGLKTLYPKEIASDMAHQLLKECRVNPTVPAFRLGIDEFADLVTGYEKQCRSMPGLFLYNYVKPKQTIDMLASKEGALPPEYLFKREKLPTVGVRLRDADKFLS